MDFIFRVDGKIRGKGRPRFSLKTKKVYSTPQDRAFEKLIRDSYLANDGIYFGDDSYLRMEIDLYFSIPKSYTKKRRQNCLNGTEMVKKKPDTDNCIKSVADSLNGVAYKDDVQIVQVECKKHYTDNNEDYMIVKIMEL